MMRWVGIHVRNCAVMRTERHTSWCSDVSGLLDGKQGHVLWRVSRATSAGAMFIRTLSGLSHGYTHVSRLDNKVQRRTCSLQNVNVVQIPAAPVVVSPVHIHCDIWSEQDHSACIVRRCEKSASCRHSGDNVPPLYPSRMGQ
jgi:hypothetical protein